MKGHKAHHHGHKKAEGGRTEMKVSGNPDVFKETKGPEFKHGGRAKKHRANGGKVAGVAGDGGGKILGLMTGGAVRPRLDRPGRKMGGRVGADKSPLSTAHHGHPDGHETPSSKDSYGGTPSD